MKVLAHKTSSVVTHVTQGLRQPAKPGEEGKTSAVAATLTHAGMQTAAAVTTVYDGLMSAMTILSTEGEGLA